MNDRILKIQDSPYQDLPVLALITFVLFALKAMWVVLISSGPAYPDELTYKLNASAIFALQKYATAHYPPLYPSVLAPAFFFKHWYEGMLIINAFLSSLVVPATWLLARTAGIRHPLLAALLAAMLPMHAIYPHLLLSENLFVPLFVLAMALALRGGKCGNAEALAFGFVLGITHLTKYLFLPTLPLLFCAWLYSRSRNMPDTGSQSLRQRYLPALLVLASYGVVMGVWLIYGLSSSFGLSKLFGFGISGSIAKAATGGSLLMWVVAYSSYVLLAWLPVWGVIAIWVSQLNNKDWWIKMEQRHWRFLVLVLLLLGCHWLVAVQHSFGAGYNYPVPQRLIGRYLMQLSPIMLVVGVLIMERLVECPAPFRKMKAWIFACVLVGLSFFAWEILFNKAYGKYYIPISDSGGVDVIALVYPQMLLMAMVMVLLIPAIMYFQKNNIRLLVLPVVAFMLVSLAVDAGRIYARQNGLHYRQMAYAVLNLNDPGDTLNIFTDSGDLSLLMSRPFRGNDVAMMMNKKRLFFWGVKQKNILIQDVSTQAGIDFALLKSPTLLISNTIFNIKPLRKYTVNGKVYYIYRIDGLDSKVLRPVILTSGKDGE